MKPCESDSVSNWKLIEDRVLKEMAEDGHSAKEISQWLAKELGSSRSKFSVAKRAQRLKVRLKPDRWNKNLTLRTWTLKLLQDGRNAHEIAKVRGVSINAAWKMIQRLHEEGIVRRVGKTSRNVRYVPVLKWDEQHG